MTQVLQRWTMLGTCAMIVAGCSAGESAGVPLAQMAAADSAAAAAPVLAPDAKLALDSGNVLFRAKNFSGALALYRSAASLSPTHPAPWFGMYMVGQATHNAKLADSAMVEMQARTVAPPPSPHGFSDSALKALQPPSARSGAGADLRQ